MDKTMDLTIGFKGQLKLDAQVVPLQEGYLKIGGTVDINQTNGLKFGVVCSADPAAVDQIEAGVASGNVIRGISVFDDAIAQNAPAHADRYLAGMPCAFLNHGFMWLAAWDKSSTVSALIDPAIGCKVVYKTDTGVIGFVAATAETAPEGYAILANADVRAIEDNHGALIYIN